MSTSKPILSLLSLKNTTTRSARGPHLNTARPQLHASKGVPLQLHFSEGSSAESVGKFSCGSADPIPPAEPFHRALRTNGPSDQRSQRLFDGPFDPLVL